MYTGLICIQGQQVKHISVPQGKMVQGKKMVHGKKYGSGGGSHPLPWIHQCPPPLAPSCMQQEWLVVVWVSTVNCRCTWRDQWIKVYVAFLPWNTHLYKAAVHVQQASPVHQLINSRYIIYSILIQQTLTGVLVWRSKLALRHTVLIYKTYIWLLLWKYWSCGVFWWQTQINMVRLAYYSTIYMLIHCNTSCYKYPCMFHGNVM